jgi:hypothetical protein
MARVFIPDGTMWFDELKAVGYCGESELEFFIRQHVTSVFPNFHVFPFKKDVTHSSTGIKKKPDLAMVRHDLKAWGIIEVEVFGPKLKHVLEQTECFVEGNYNAPDVAEYMRKQIQEHCKKKVVLRKLEALVAAETPLVLVIADTLNDNWLTRLEELGVGFCVFEVFKNTKGHYLYRTLGAYPVVPTREAHCRRHRWLPNTVQVIGNFEFNNLIKKNQVEIVFDDTITRWTRMVDRGGQHLRFLGQSNPISPNTTYGLFADKTERYHFRIN